MVFNDFKKLQATYKDMARGVYNEKKVAQVYKTLPQEFKVSPASKNEKIAAIKVYFEEVFLKAIEKIIPNGYSGDTSS